MCWPVVFKVEVPNMTGVSTGDQQLAPLLCEAAFFVFIEVDGDPFSRTFVVQSRGSAYLVF
jgi:hypothetical protein